MHHFAARDLRLFPVLSAENSVVGWRSFGGTSPENIAAEARKWLKRLEQTRQSR